MRTQIVIRFIGEVLILNSVFLFISTLISVFYKESSAVPLAYSAFIALIFGLFPMIFVERATNLNFNEGILIVVLSWIITCMIGTLPYILWGGEFTLINAWFESVSGYTTTGSSILTNVEILPKGLLFWRSSTHWIGGIGIIVFVLLILPHPKSSRFILFRSEVSDLTRVNFKYRARNILIILITIYAGLTLIETLLLLAGGMNLFDAVNHSFATIATGGFSTKNLSIAAYNSLYIEIVVMIFMVLSGMHFGLLFSTITFKKPNLFNSSILKTYLIVLSIGIIIVTLSLFSSHYFNFWNSLRYASFQVISLGTSTGFATADTPLWPSLSVIVLMYFIIQGAMVGSTTGGIKIDRVFIFFKSILKHLKLMKHPDAVISMKVDNEKISDKLEASIYVFIITYIFVFFVTTIILCALKVDLITAFSASIATIGGVGPGFGSVNSMGNFSQIPVIGKLALSINMLLGRLEIFSIVALFYIKRIR